MVVTHSLQQFAEFKVDMHNIFIRARKDLMKQWMKLPFVATDDAIFTVLEAWPPVAELESLVAHKKKDDAKLCIT